MAQFRPAGLSDEDSDSDDYGFYEKPIRTYHPVQQLNTKKKIENNLQDAILNGNLKEVEKIVTCDLENVNVKLDSGWNALMHACFHAQDKIVDLLLDKGANPNCYADSVSPVMLACSNSSASEDAVYNIITKLIEKNCGLNVGDKYQQTPLMRAIGSGRVGIVQLLLDNDVNIEMRDTQGWTAVYWAVHNNQPEILEMLIKNGARLSEVDMSGRTLTDIALSHDYQHLIEILEQHTKPDDDTEIEKAVYCSNHQSSWHDYYPGLVEGFKPNYEAEISGLLYGMNCDRLIPIMNDAEIDLRTFLLMDEDEMKKMGIDMVYERHRLKQGLQEFHKRGWAVTAASGMLKKPWENYSVLECLTSLGAHLQQVYILEATLQYTLREYNNIHNQIKFEPPDSPLIKKLKTAANKIVTNINRIRMEIKFMKRGLTKISKNNPQPADLIKEKSAHEIAKGYFTEVLVVCSLGFLAYYAKNLVTNFLKK